jgi:hypothetical protein
MSYSYDRTANRDLKAGRNGRLRIEGQNNGPKSSGKLSFYRPITMSPRFVGKDLEEAINRHGRGGLERILQAVSRQVPKLQTQITDAYASDSSNIGLEMVATATWKGDADQLVAALTGFSDSLGYTLDNWL